MATPFAIRWEVSSLRSNHGSFVEAAKVKPLQGQDVGDVWVERPVMDLKPAHLARVQRRWWLASELTSLAWPALVDAGEDGGSPWAVIESPGSRMDGSFPFTDPILAVRTTRALALGVAEAEALLLEHCTSPHVSLRASTLGRDSAGRLRLHLAALDPDPDLGFPSAPSAWMWTAEELFGQPQTARSNVFALGWLACLMLTGRSPYGLTFEGLTEKVAKEALKPLVAAGKFSFSLPEHMKALEPILKRALSAQPAQRHASAAVFAETLAQYAPGAPPVRAANDKQPKLPVPELDWRYEAIPFALESKLINATDDSLTWTDLAHELDLGHSPRAKAIRGDAAAQAQLTPEMQGEKLTLTWGKGYVRALGVEPAGKVEHTEARILELTAALQHPSLKFVNELNLKGPLAHAKLWLEVLQRYAPPGLKRITTDAIAATDAFAVDIAFRFPRWTWLWGQPQSGGFFKKLFGA